MQPTIETFLKNTRQLSDEAYLRTFPEFLENSMINQDPFYFDVEKKGDCIACIECNTKVGYGLSPGTIMIDKQTGDLAEYVIGDVAGKGALISLKVEGFKNEGLTNFIIYDHPFKINRTYH